MMGADPSCRSRARAGFTLIELLAAMTILVLIVLMLTRLYGEGASAIQIGKRNTERNMNARAVMDFMARELSMAVFDYGSDPTTNYLGFAYYANVGPDLFGVQSDTINFVTLNKDVSASGNPGDRRSAYHIQYFVDDMDGLTDAPENPRYRFALWRTGSQPQQDGFAYQSLTDASLKWMGDSPASWSGFTRNGMLIDNVRTFEIFVYTDPAGASTANWTSWNDPPIAFLDIYLETMDEQDARQAARLADNLGPSHSTVVDFVERVVKRNYRRVYMPNLKRSQEWVP